MVQRLVHRAQPLVRGRADPVHPVAERGEDALLVVGTQAAREIARAYKAGRLKLKDIDADTFETFLYTYPLPDPDILIRTSGEFRLSTFLLWQTSYTEIFVTDTLWPDFSEREFVEIILEYQKRERRFGKL
jgi:undecaprenyl diphosphate synthase